MFTLFTKIMAVFCTSLAVGVLYRIPKTSLLLSSITGVTGWLVYALIAGSGGKALFAVFLGSIVIAVIGESLARVLKQPATVFIIPGFIPLVPGKDAYFTMLYLVQGNYQTGFQTAVETALTAGAIAVGIFMVTTAARTIFLRGRDKPC